MTSNQRRSGFRLPWASETEEATTGETGGAASTDSADAVGSATVEQPVNDHESATASAESESAATSAAPAPEPVSPGSPAPAPPSSNAAPSGAEADKSPAAAASGPSAESSAGFMRDLVAAMRRVAEETRQSGLFDLRTKAEEQVRTLEADAERRREHLTARAETDVAGVGDWAATETERIKQEAEQRVVARRAALDQQLAAETTRAEAEAKALRDRVASYEQELDAYHAQLSDIADPAAFAAAAKRMPAPPHLGDSTADATPPAASGAIEPAPTAVHPAEEEVLASRLAELDAALEDAPEAQAPDTPATTAAPSAESTATEIVVKGLGSFGAITGFRQALAAVEGIEGVSLSLGPTGEFVFRAIHSAGLDVAAAITTLEGDAATVESQGENGLRITLERAR